jgi:signal transduction histidine kinase
MRLAVPQRDEIGVLAHELDTMCAQLEEAVDARAAALVRLQHADRLATVGQLASGVAHELGTPLNTVALRAKISEDPDLSPERRRTNASIMVEECTRMASIIRQLLDFARPTKVERSPVWLPDIVENAVRLLDPVAHKAHVLLEAQPYHGDTSMHVQGNAHQLIQVVTNLLVNAIHAQPDGGHVHLRIRNVSEGKSGLPEGAPPMVRLDVIDQGMGIAQENLPHVFDPFFTTKEVGQGTGLGLSVAYGIVRDHGGWVDVRSVVGVGTTFSVYLPLAARDGKEVAS